MNDDKAEDIFLDNIVEINQLWHSIREMMYMSTNPHVDTGLRDKEAKRQFGMSLAKLGIIKERRNGKRTTHS